MAEVPKQLKPFIFKKGNKAAAGKHKKSMKVYAREYLENLPEKERIAFLNSLDKELVWKMAEGNPKHEVETELNLKVSKLEEIQKLTKQILND